MSESEEVGDGSVVVVTTDPLFEMESLGYRYGSNCLEAEVPSGSYVNYFEVAYSADD